MKLASDLEPPVEPWPPEGIEEMPDRERDAAERIEYRVLLDRYHPEMFSRDEVTERPNE